MKRIYKRSDRIAVKIDDITLKLAPLTFDQKNEVQSYMRDGIKNGTDLPTLTKGITLAMKYAIKAIDGFEDGDGQPYKLQSDELGNLTDECIDDLLNLEEMPRMTMILMTLLKGVPSSFTDNQGNPLEGVEFVSSGDAKSPNV